jgi:hypothetical protein
MYPGNHTDSEILSVPRNLKTRPGAPETHLAYITDDEADLLEIYKPDTPHKGPHDVPNYDSFDLDSSGSYTGGSDVATSTYSTSSGGSQPSEDYWEPPSNPVNTVTHYEDYYTEPTPEDIIYDDQIADYSFSTHDVRSTPEERLDFRGETGSEIRTNAENLAAMAYNLTNDPKYLNMPIFVPGGMSGWKNDELYQSLLAKYKEAMATGNKELFFEAVEDLQDITAGNPNLQFQEGFGTGYDEWYKTPGSVGGGRSGGGGWYSGRGGRGGFGGGGGGSRMQVAGAGGDGHIWPRWGPFTQQGDYIRNLRRANRGGIVSLC